MEELIRSSGVKYEVCLGFCMKEKFNFKKVITFYHTFICRYSLKINRFDGMTLFSIPIPFVFTRLVLPFLWQTHPTHIEMEWGGQKTLPRNQKNMVSGTFPLCS